MKTIKTLMLSGMLVFSMTTGAFATEEEVTKGPVETYYDCAVGCIQRTPPWSLKRTVCATDCYIQLIKSLVHLLTDEAISG
jgi:hypothetical protein